MMTEPVAAEAEPVPTPGDRVYFPELDGLRFVAFAAVYLFHRGVPQFTGWVNELAGLVVAAWPGAREWLPFDLGSRLQDNGWVGVQLFFILSGYLIATLLIREEARFGRVSLRAFWARRILRIWPLYYLTMAIAFVVLPALDGMGLGYYWSGYGRHLPYFLAFAGNWSMGLLGPVGNDAVSVLWSVCVEEQFYILCPLLFAWVGRRWRLPLVLSMMAAGPVGRHLMARSGANPLLFQYSSITHLDTLLSGILLALVAGRAEPGERLSRALRVLQWPLYLAIAWLLTRPGLAHATTRNKTWDFVSLWLLGVGLVAVARFGRGRLGRALAYSRVVWLGKISYGLYMFHEVALWATRHAEARLGWFPNREVLLTIAAFALTVGLAAASYYGFERPFLRLKRRWTRVPSRPV